MGSSLQKPAAGGEAPAQQQMRYIPDPSVNHALPGNWQGFSGMRRMLPSQPGGPQLFTDPPGGVQNTANFNNPDLFSWLRMLAPQAPQAPMGAPPASYVDRQNNPGFDNVGGY